MMHQRDLDALHTARAALRRHGVETSALDGQIDAIVQVNEDERAARDLPPDPLERGRLTLLQTVDALSDTLEDPAATVARVRAAGVAVCAAAIREDPPAREDDDPITADAANHRDCALMLRTVRAIASRRQGAVLQGGYGTLLDSIERALVAIQELHWDVRIVARDARERARRTT